MAQLGVDVLAAVFLVEVLLNNTGGGGYGDPFDRDPERVARDVKNGFVTAQAAERDYGVAL